MTRKLACMTSPRPTSFSLQSLSPPLSLNPYPLLEILLATERMALGYLLLCLLWLHAGGTALSRSERTGKSAEKRASEQASKRIARELNKQPGLASGQENSIGDSAVQQQRCFVCLGFSLLLPYT
jgi:hypothetical protein